VLPEIASAGWVLAYVSKTHEIDTHGLIQQLLAIGKQVCVPAFDGTARSYGASQLQDFHWDLIEGKFGILEPKRESVHPIKAGQLDALLLPGLAFDVHGNRVGRGLGYFDRLLTEASGMKIALAHDFQVLDEVHVESHDVRMDFIVTEKRMVSCKGTKL
jgi:5-formyltetrahydrofolate cyclo-ligase